MKLEQQVVSLELSNELKSFDVKQESTFYWSYEVDVEDKYFLGPKHNGFNLLCSAFTVAELGEMLPREVRGFQLEISKDENCKSGKVWWRVRYYEEDYGVGGRETRLDEFNETNLSDCFAKMLIHLIEQGIVKP